MKPINLIQSQVGGKYEIDIITLKFICKYRTLNTWHQCISVGEKKTGNSVGTTRKVLSYYLGKYKAETLLYSLHYNTFQINKIHKISIMQLYNKGTKANTQWHVNCQKKTDNIKENILIGQTCQAIGGYLNIMRHTSEIYYQIDSLKSHAQIFTLTRTNI